MADPSDDLKAKLTKLSPDARARVEGALKTHLESALEEEARALGGGGGGQIQQFSRGILFSKSGSNLRNGEEVILPSIIDMDDAKFATFMNRVNTLKGTKGGGG